MNSADYYIGNICIFFRAQMDITAGTVSAGPNLTGRIYPTIHTLHTDWIQFDTIRSEQFENGHIF